MKKKLIPLIFMLFVVFGFAATKEKIKEANDFIATGNTKLTSKDLQGAEADFTLAIAANPEGVKAYYLRGKVRRDLGQNAKAIEDFDIAAELSPKDKWVFYNRGLTKKAMADYSGAVADYDKALEIDPNLTEAINSKKVAEGLIK
ncbi:MAG: tetratricopeptide repeat protein [Fusobacteriaceae bacterium]